MESPEVKKESPSLSMSVKRRPKKIKNLEREVELILSQDEMEDNTADQLPQTPSTSNEGQQQSRYKDATTPRASEMATLKELMQTPRRSCRKSIKPAQDYDDIVKRSMRSVGRSAKKSLMTFDEEENEENMESLQVDEDSQPKWTTAVVGKSSSKRVRKSRRYTTATKGKRNNDEEEKQTEVMTDSDGLRKLDEDCVINKETINVKSFEKETETAQEEISAIEDKCESGHVSVENTKETVEHVDTVPKQSINAMDICIVPEVVIESPKEDGEIHDNRQNEETSVVASENVDEGEEEQQQPQKDHIDVGYQAKAQEDIVHLIQEEHEDFKILPNNASEQCKTTENVDADVVEDQPQVGEDTKVEDIVHLIQEDPEDFKIPPNNASEQCKTTENVDVVEDQPQVGEDTKSQKEHIDNIEDIGDQAKDVVAENEDIIDLIQEDSEDFKDLSMNENPQYETTGAKYENTDNAININAKDDKELSNDSFGSYLKSNKINVTDLGLIPLNEEDDDVAETGDATSPLSALTTESEEMPSLIILDDDDEVVVKEEETYNAEVAEECNIKHELNKTFEAVEEVTKENTHAQRSSFESCDAADKSMQSFLLNEAAAKLAIEETMEMDALKMSDDEETPQKAPRIVLTTTDEKNMTILSTPKGSSKPCTPNQKAKPFRFPTPHSNKVVNREPWSSSKKLPMRHNNMSLALTALEPREIVLRGIRKRSLSMCLGVGEVNNAAGDSAAKRQRPLKGPLATYRRQKAVNFFSPANQTTIIDDIDKIMADSVRKDQKEKRIHQTTNVTTRRKRSLSLDESMMSKSLISKLPRPAAANIPSLSMKSTAPTLSSSSPSSSKMTRTKLPNFAAIHQKRFQKMESLADHVARKQERSKVLINSATKIKQASAQKLIKSGNLEKPKALKKIELGGSSQMKVKSLYNPLATKTLTTADNSALKKTASKENNHSMLVESNLPHPRDLPQPMAFKFMNKHQQHLLKKQHLKPTQTMNVVASTKSTSSTSVKKQKPFNLSTQVTTRPLMSKSKTESTASISSLTTFNATTSSSSSSNVFSLSTQDKIASRQQRHMDLFKGRVPSARSGVASRNIDANIRGVRSNRRFELQMQHRKNLEN